MNVPVNKQTLLPLSFGADYTGLAATVQYKLIKADNTLLQDWTNSNVFEVGAGSYAAPYTFITEGVYILEGRETTQSLVTDLPDVIQVAADSVNNQGIDDILAKLALFTSAKVTFISPVVSDDLVYIVAQNDYTAVDNRALVWTKVGETWPDLTGQEVEFSIEEYLSKSMTVLQPRTVQLELTAAETDLSPGVYNFEITATISGRIATLIQGKIVISKRILGS